MLPGPAAVLPSRDALAKHLVQSMYPQALTFVLTDVLENSEIEVRVLFGDTASSKGCCPLSLDKSEASACVCVPVCD